MPAQPSDLLNVLCVPRGVGGFLPLTSIQPSKQGSYALVLILKGMAGVHVSLQPVVSHWG